MCSRLVLRHKALSHKETKWWTTSGYENLVVSLACRRSRLLLMWDKVVSSLKPARGTSHAIDVAQLVPCVTGASVSSSGQPSQVSNTSAESKSKRPLFKLDKYDGSTSLDTSLSLSLVFCSYEQVLDIAPGRRKRRSDGADILSWEI